MRADLAFKMRYSAEMVNLRQQSSARSAAPGAVEHFLAGNSFMRVGFIYAYLITKRFYLNRIYWSPVDESARIREVFPL